MILKLFFQSVAAVEGWPLLRVAAYKRIARFIRAHPHYKSLPLILALGFFRSEGLNLEQLGVELQPWVGTGGTFTIENIIMSSSLLSLRVCFIYIGMQKLIKEPVVKAAMLVNCFIYCLSWENIEPVRCVGYLFKKVSILLLNWWSMIRKLYASFLIGLYFLKNQGFLEFCIMFSKGPSFVWSIRNKKNKVDGAAIIKLMPST